MESLNQFVSRLTVNHLPAAVQNHSFFINNIPADLAIENNRQWIASVISGLLSTVAGHAKNTCIRLSAKKNGHVIVFMIQESGNTNSYAMASDLSQAYLLAEKIGGCLSVSVPVMNNTTISFSFPNLQPVAA